MRAISLGYHDVNDTCDLPAHKKIYTLERRHFEDHLESIRIHAGRDAVQTISAPRIGQNGVPVFLTFDDGAESAYTFVAGLLEERGWRGHFFIITNWIGRPGYVDRRQIRELHSRGHVIGSHTCTHP